MRWRAVYAAQWGRDPVDVTVASRDEGVRVLEPEIRVAADQEVCQACREQGKDALRQMAGDGTVEAEIDGELYWLGPEEDAETDEHLRFYLDLTRERG